MANKPRSWGRRIAVGIAGLVALVLVVYFAGFQFTKSDPAKLGAWGTDLDKAFAEAASSGKMVVVKAGSEY